MNLYEISDQFKQIYENIEIIANADFDTDADGNCIDANGNIIENPDAYKADLIEAWCNSIDDIKIGFDEKAEQIAICIKNLKADSEKIEAEEKALKARKELKKRELNRWKDYLKTAMEQAGVLKVDMPKANISIRNNAESVVIDNEIDFIAWAQEHNDGLLKYSMPEIKKSDVKKALQSGDNLPCAHLIRTQSVIIK